MKKFYIIALCCAVGIAAQAGHRRFVSQRGNDKNILATSLKADKGGRLKVMAAAGSEVWRPVSQTEYMFNGVDWDEMGIVNFKYDNRGNVTEESYDEDGVTIVTVRTYDSNNMVTSLLTTASDGVTAENREKRTYVYDPIVTDFYTERLGYDWAGGQWTMNHYCDRNQITRDGGNNITEIVKSLLLDTEFIPAYKSEWSYDAATGKADRFDYYANYGGQQITWELDDELSYRDIVWERTDGQMTGHINELLEGSNRVKQYSVYYDDVLDGHVFVEYSQDHPDDYLMKSTFADPSEVGYTQQVETTDANGSKRITDTEYFDEDGNVTTEPTYQSVEIIKIDSYGNIVSDEILEGYDGDEPELVMGEASDIKYDAKGNPTEVVVSIYDYDSGEYMPDSRIVYGEYSDVSLAVSDIADADADAPVVYYNLQGMRVDNPNSGLYIRRQGKSAAKVWL